jgi:CO/xanthine dehydrogenase FAD-binding subunit
LLGRSVTDDLERLAEPSHLSVLSPIDDVRASASYRLAAAEKLIQRSLRRLRETQ